MAKIKENILGITAKKETDFSEWYTQIVTRCELIDYYDVSGCYIIRPNAFTIWEHIQDYLKKKLKADGVRDAYFPIFVSKGALEKEKDHVEGFSAEVAWVTKSGRSDLQEPIAIRPTSETIIYPAFAKWVRSYRDLPLKVNQWCNVVRWEFSHPQPFLRTREFLWQEGHTAHRTKEEADTQVNAALDWYRDVYENVLAVPVIKGRKSLNEQFPGALYTHSVETYIPGSKRGIQAGTSHALGQNFSKMFKIEVDCDESEERDYVWQTSWGLSTRSIGIMIMIHADNKGMVIPPKVASTQVIIIPCGITAKTPTDKKEKITAAANRLCAELNDAQITCQIDDRINYTTGWKFNEWELKGTPVRIEVGPRDLETNNVVVFRRDTLEKEPVPIDGIALHIKNLLASIMNDMLTKARNDMNKNIITTTTWESLLKTVQNGQIAKVPWCEIPSCEKTIRERTVAKYEDGSTAMGAKSLCIFLDQDEIPAGTNCPNCNNPSKSWTIFARSY